MGSGGGLEVMPEATDAPLGQYENVVRAIVTEPAVLYALQKETPLEVRLDAWARAVALPALHFEVFAPYIRLLMGYEVGRTPASLRTGGCAELTKEFLRGTSLLSKSLDIFTQCALRDFVERVSGGVVRTILKGVHTLGDGDGGAAEGEADAQTRDPVVLSFDDESATRSVELVERLVDAFLTAFDAATQDAHPLLRAICADIGEIAGDVGGDAVAMTGAFIMLRCLSPSLVDPGRYGMLETGVVLDEAAMKNLVTVSRVLQRLANGATFATFEGDAYRRLDALLGASQGRYREIVMKLVREGTAAVDANAIADRPAAARRPSHLVCPPRYSLELNRDDVLAGCHLLHEVLGKCWSRLHVAMGHCTPFLDHHAVLRGIKAALPNLPRKCRVRPCDPADAGAAARPGGAAVGVDADGEREEIEEIEEEEDPVAQQYPFLLPFPADHEHDDDYSRVLFDFWALPPSPERARQDGPCGQRWLRVAGMAANRTAVVQLYPHRMPLGDMSTRAREALNATFIHLLDGLARGPYTLVLLNEGSQCKTAYAWLKKLYDTVLPYFYDENLTCLHVLHPCMWTKATLWLPRGGTFPTVQLHTSLRELLDELQINPKRFPATEALLKNEPSAAGFDTVRTETRDYAVLPYRCIRWLEVNAHLSKERVFRDVPPVVNTAPGGGRRSATGRAVCSSRLDDMLEDLVVRSERDLGDLLMGWVRGLRGDGGAFGARAGTLCEAAAAMTTSVGNGAEGDHITHAHGSGNTTEEEVIAALAPLGASRLAFLEDFFLLLRGFALEGDPVDSPSALADRLTPSLFVATAAVAAAPPTAATAVTYLIVQPAEFWRRVRQAARAWARDSNTTDAPAVHADPSVP